MKLLCLDLETTGLEPDKDLVLEVGALAVENFEAKAGFNRVIWQPEPDLDRLMPEGSKVREMHQASGLLGDIQRVGVSMYHVTLGLAQFYKEHFGDEQVPLMGANPGFDRSFLKVHMPEVHKLLHYRNLDTNSLWLLRRWYGGSSGTETKPGTAHRALQDCCQAMGEVRRMLDWAGKT